MVAVVFVAVVASIMINIIIGLGSGVATGNISAGAAAATTIVEVIFTAAVGILAAPLTLTTYADMRARVEPVSTGVLAHELNNS
jgi:hypothetical protein